MNLNCELHIMSSGNNQKYRVYFDNELILEKELSPVIVDNVKFSVDVESGTHQIKLEKLLDYDLHILKLKIDEEIIHNHDETLTHDVRTYIINT